MCEDIQIEQVGDGLYTLTAVIVPAYDGINIYVGGGERPHIGTVVISEPRESLKNAKTISCTTSVYNFLGHKDDFIAVPIAEAICINTGKTVVVSAGIHIDNATQDDIDTFMQNKDKLIKEILLNLNRRKDS
ncbi:MAG TPA: hypothetical protein GX534_04915 [Thermoanaerobacterales bacterium]|nr:hypothetical protein [Thermoanaerobacterales bacterium]